MKRFRFIFLLVALVVAASLPLLLLVFRARTIEPIAPAALDTSRGPAFEVLVEKPRGSRPLFGILPTRVERKLFGGGELRFDNATKGAAIESNALNRLEFRADGWDLMLVTDSEGRIAPETFLVFPILLAEKERTLRCRPADHPTGYLRAMPAVGSDLHSGTFLVELAICENAGTRKIIEWPPAPLVVKGSFAGLPNLSRSQPK